MPLTNLFNQFTLTYGGGSLTTSFLSYNYYVIFIDNFSKSMWFFHFNTKTIFFKPSLSFTLGLKANSWEKWWPSSQTREVNFKPFISIWNLMKFTTVCHAHIPSSRMVVLNGNTIISSRQLALSDPSISTSVVRGWSHHHYNLHQSYGLLQSSQSIDIWMVVSVYTQLHYSLELWLSLLFESSSFYYWQALSVFYLVHLCSLQLPQPRLSITFLCHR